MIPVRYNHDTYANNIVFNKPTQGYLRVQAGEAIEISGSVITKENIQSQVLVFQLTKFQNGDYQTSGKKTFVQMNEELRSIRMQGYPLDSSFFKKITLGDPYIELILNGGKNNAR
ncbi:hypothetical protein [Paenibacillus sp. NPDC057934]|uniref:hypothetical protein n=1 Tax=Paenibacillus sp. NPDC057934 TaxID=3346282 RepID=UPI0036DE2ED0